MGWRRVLTIVLLGMPNGHAREHVSKHPHPDPIQAPPIPLPLPKLEVGVGDEQIKKEGNVSHLTFLSPPPYPQPQQAGRLRG